MGSSDAEGKCEATLYDLDKQIAVLQQKAIDADKAVIVALDNLSRRLDEMNQFRAQISEERNTFLTKEVFDSKHEELAKKVDALTLAKSNQDGRLWALGVIGFICTVALNILFRYLFR
jgi:hypothetical protein